MESMEVADNLPEWIFASCPHHRCCGMWFGRLLDLRVIFLCF